MRWLAAGWRGPMLGATMVVATAAAHAQPQQDAPRLMVQAAAGGLLGVQMVASQDGRLLATLAPGGAGMQVWDRASGRVLCLLAAEGGAAADPRPPMVTGTAGLAFSPGGEQLVSAAARGLRVWDLRRCQQARQWSAPAEVSQMLAVAGGRQLLLDRRGQLWIGDAFAPGGGFKPLAQAPRGVRDLVAASSDGLQILVKTGGGGGPLAAPDWARLHIGTGAVDLVSGYQGVTPVTGLGALTQTAALSPSGRWIALHAAGRLQLLDSQERRAVAADPASQPPVAGRQAGGRAAAHDTGTPPALPTLPLGDMRAAIEGMMAQLPPEARAQARGQLDQVLGRAGQIAQELGATAQAGGRPALPTWIGFSPDERRLHVWRNLQAGGPATANAADPGRTVLELRRLPDLGIERETVLTEAGAASGSLAPTALGFASSADRRWLLVSMAMLDGGGARLGALDLAAAAPGLQGWRSGAGGAAQLHWRGDDQLIALQAPQMGGSVLALGGRSAAGAGLRTPGPASLQASARTWGLRDGQVLTHATASPVGHLPRASSPGGALVAVARVDLVDVRRAMADTFIDVLDGRSLVRLRAVQPQDGQGRALRGMPAALALRDDGSLIMAIGLVERDDGQAVLSLHDGRDGRMLSQRLLPFPLASGVGGPSPLRLSADQRLLAIQGDGRQAATLRLDDPRQPVLTLADLPGQLLAVVGSAPMRWLVGSSRRRDPGTAAGGGGLGLLTVAHADLAAAALSGDGRLLATAGADGVVQTRPLAADGTPGAVTTLAGLGGTVVSLSFSPDGRRLAGSADNGSIGIWDLARGGLLLRLFAFGDGSWAVVDRDGRFDTNRIEDLESLHWVLPSEPFRPLPLEIFMQAFYQPGLLARTLAGEALPAVADLRQLNTAQPEVSILSITPTPGRAGFVDVEVQAVGRRDAAGREAGVTGLRLFRDGRLVAPPAVTRPAVEGQRQQLRYAAVRLPSGAREVRFSAYAFNRDQVKSATVQRSHRADLPPAKGRAYLVAIGINRHDDPAWNLSYAVNDARATLDSLQRRLVAAGAHAEVVSLPLLADGRSARAATKEVIRAVLAQLAGGPAAAIPGVDLSRLRAATPDDLVLLSFAGHGMTDPGGQFLLLPQDAHAPGDASERPSRGISADELADWLGRIDAGELALVIDACQSAASVDRAGFRPGPLGSRGLGQLAYDKGARVLAATQADNVAVENEKLRHGLLTFALVRDGLDAGLADFRPADKQISLGEWLAYGVVGVPRLQADLRSGRRAGRGMTLDVGAGATTLSARPLAQQPRLFDFAHSLDGPWLVPRR